MTQITINLQNPEQERKLWEFIQKEGLEVTPPEEAVYQSLRDSVKEYKQYKNGTLKPKSMEEFLEELRNA
jgi:hypothetical protein